MALSFWQKVTAAATITLGSLFSNYARADPPQPKKPVEEMTEQEYKEFKAENAQWEKEENARIDAEAKKTEADKAVDVTKKPITAKLDVQTYEIKPEACRCPVPGDNHGAGFIRGFIAKEFDDSGFDGTLDAKIPVGKELFLFGRLDYASQKGFEGDAKATRKEYSALFGISGDTTIRANLVKQLGTLDHKTSEHNILLESPLIEQDVTVDDETDSTGTLYSLLFKQNINDVFAFVVGGFSGKTGEKGKTNVRSDTTGLITELLEFEIKNKTAYVDQGGNIGIEAKLADGFLLGGKLRYMHSETDASIDSPYLHEETTAIVNQVQPLLTGRYNLIAVEIGGNFTKEKQAGDHSREKRLIVSLAGVIPAGKLMFLPRAGLNRTEGRGYANVAIMFNHENDYTVAQSQQLLSWDIAQHDGADDSGLTRRQIRNLQFDRLAQLVNAVPGTYFSAGVDTPSKRYHEYTFRLATDAGKLIPGLTGAAELTVAREYKFGRMRLSENLVGGLTIYLEGGFEKDDKAETSTKYAGVGAQIEFGGE